MHQARLQNLLAISLALLAGCAGPRVNRDPDADAHTFARDPELWWHLQELNVPQDDKLH
jgi:hypothetical protein